MKSLDFIQQFTYRELGRSSYKNCGIVGQFPKSRVWATFLHCIHSTTVQQAYAGRIQNSGTAPESLYWHFHAPVSPSNFLRISRKEKNVTSLSETNFRFIFKVKYVLFVISYGQIFLTLSNILKICIYSNQVKLKIFAI